MSQYDEYLSDIQIAFRDFIKDYDLTWSWYLTLRYNYIPRESRAVTDANLIQRHIGKTLRTQVLYLGIFAKAKHNAFAHAHILIHTKKPSYLSDRFLLTTTVTEDFYLKSIFPFKHNYKLDLIEDNYFRSIERISQYIVKKDHMADGSFFLITSQPKRLRKYLKK